MQAVREYSGEVIAGSAMPEVPIAPGVNVAALKARDPEALFVVMPIAQVGRTSNAGIYYDRELVESIAEQINTARAGAIFGHVAKSESESAFPLHSAIWVGARLVGDTLFAKAYLRTKEAREFWLDAQATGMKVGTSIYGQAMHEPRPDGTTRLRHLALENVDFAPAARASLWMGGQFALVTEMADSAGQPTVAQAANVDALVAELVGRAEHITGRMLTPYAWQEIAAYTRKVAEYELSKRWATRTAGILRDAQDLARRAKDEDRDHERRAAEQWAALEPNLPSDPLQRARESLEAHHKVRNQADGVAVRETVAAVAGTLTEAQALDQRARERRSEAMLTLMQAEKPLVRDGEATIREIHRLIAGG